MVIADQYTVEGNLTRIHTRTDTMGRTRGTSQEMFCTRVNIMY
jgi:hypothetical protein